MKARAVMIRAHGGPEVLEVVEVDVKDPGPDEVRIRQHAIGLNFIDIYHRTGLYANALPHGLGSEGAGVVEAVGSNVKFLKAGDRVAYPQGPIGAYSEMRTMPVATVVKLPKKIGFDQAAAVMLKGLTVQYLLRQTYRLQGTETILFHAAAGGVGLIACQWARALGVKLIGTVSTPEKAALAKKYGAWETIDYTKENFVERVLALTKGAKLPVVYDSVGKDTWEGSLDCVQPRGLMVSFGNASDRWPASISASSRRRVRCSSRGLRWRRTSCRGRASRPRRRSCSTCWRAAGSRSTSSSATRWPTQPARTATWRHARRSARR
jgi:NADPH2:quinone reductase